MWGNLSKPTFKPIKWDLILETDVILLCRSCKFTLHFLFAAY